MRRERNIPRDKKIILNKRKPKIGGLFLKIKSGIFERIQSLYQIKIKYMESQTNTKVHSLWGWKG